MCPEIFSNSSPSSKLEWDECNVWDWSLRLTFDMQGEHPFLFSIVTYRHPRAFNRAIIRPAPFESPECAVNHSFSRWIWRRLNISENLGECCQLFIVRPRRSPSVSESPFRRFWYPRLQFLVNDAFRIFVLHVGAYLIMPPLPDAVFTETRN
jgi:hypothetical protein